MMVVLVSRSGYCTITARYDRAAITDQDLFARCLQEGFDEVLALAGDPPPTSTPASFSTDDVAQSTDTNPSNSAEGRS